MKLFTLENNLPVITPEALLIPEFKKIWNSDKSKLKEKAQNELAYIYYSTDYKSIYLGYTDEVRRERLGEDFMNDSKYIPSKDISDASIKYEEFQQTPTMNFLKSARHAMQETQNYFNSIDYSERDSKNNPIYKLTEVTKALKDCAGIKDSLDKLEQAVKREQSSSNTARGGGSGGLFETED